MNEATLDTKVDPQIVAIRNDIFRLTTHQMRVTDGIWKLKNVSDVIDEVRYFNNFTEDNDPYHEHDFGVINWKEVKIFWKIDYFDSSLTYWCNPMSKDCRRVLTVFLSSEY